MPSGPLIGLCYEGRDTFTQEYIKDTTKKLFIKLSSFEFLMSLKQHTKKGVCILAEIADHNFLREYGVGAVQ